MLNLELDGGWVFNSWTVAIWFFIFDILPCSQGLVVLLMVSLGIVLLFSLAFKCAAVDSISAIFSPCLSAGNTHAHVRSCGLEGRHFLGPRGATPSMSVV